ncbi:nuclear transport factor 2 family protein [Nocardia sp. NPDC059239]|uniref:nuclear transport factor 2 family protein n=1 Tax=unclassified Nocardia TaxID=2637762 RepID=UPI00369B85D7
MSDLKPEDVVRSFYADWDTLGFRKSYEKHLHPEVTVENTGFPDWHGRDFVLQMLDIYMDAFQRPFGRVEILNMASNGNVVLTERIEHNENRETGDTYSGKLMTTFVIEDGLIKRWAEYYDPAPYKFGAAVPLGQSGYKAKHAS